MEREVAALQAAFDSLPPHDEIVTLVLSEPPANWAGPTGRLDEPALAQLLDVESAADWLYIVCGPAPMIDSAKKKV